MNEPTDCSQKCWESFVGAIRRCVRFILNMCDFDRFVRRLVREEMEFERARVAKDEAEVWASAFGAAAPADRKAQTRMIIRIASAKAFLANLNERSSA